MTTSSTSSTCRDPGSIGRLAWKLTQSADGVLTSVRGFSPDEVPPTVSIWIPGPCLREDGGFRKLFEGVPPVWRHVAPRPNAVVHGRESRGMADENPACVSLLASALR
jgi:hypothetical protein